MSITITLDVDHDDPRTLVQVFRAVVALKDPKLTQPEGAKYDADGDVESVWGHGVTVAYETASAPTGRLSVVHPAKQVVPSPPATETQVKHLFSLYREYAPDGSDEDRHAFTARVLGHQPSWSWNRKQMTVRDYEVLAETLKREIDLPFSR